MKTSSQDQRHQLELTLHEVQTNLDDLRHDIHYFKTDLQILDGRIKHSEHAITKLKQQDLEKQQEKIEQLSTQILAIEKRLALSDKTLNKDAQELEHLTSHAKEISTALTQFKQRIEELEKELVIGQRQFEEFGKLKSNIERLTKSMTGIKTPQIYKVRQGDSLKKIAKLHKTSVEILKKTNNLEEDLIVIGQELILPSE